MSRLTAEDDDIATLLTAPAPHRSDLADLSLAPPADTAAPSWLRHFLPDVLIWLRGDLSPGLLAATEGLGLARFFANASARPFSEGPSWWRAGTQRTTLGRFDRILAQGPGAASDLRRLGADPDRVEIAGPLEDAPAAPPADPDLMAELTAGLQVRPVWAALSFTAAEAPFVAAAHRQALRHALRLLLVALPRDAAASEALRGALLDLDLSCADWTDGVPEETVDAVLAEDTATTGTWLRLATATFQGGTLAGGGGPSPALAAARGSAIIHGPVLDPWADSYRRLSRASAARAVPDGPGLAEAVAEVIRPDRAAALSFGAWDAVSRGATVTNRVIDLVRAALDGEAV